MIFVSPAAEKEGELPPQNAAEELSHHSDFSLLRALVILPTSVSLLAVDELAPNQQPNTTAMNRLRMTHVTLLKISKLSVFCRNRMHKYVSV